MSFNGEVIMSFIGEAIRTAFTPTAVVVLIAYLGRIYFQKTLDRDLEAFKSRLATEGHNLQQQASLVNERRAEVVASLYGKVVEASLRMEALVSPLQFGGQDVEAKKSEAWNASVEATMFFEKRRIYLTEPICELVSELLELLRDSFSKFHIAVRDGEYETNDPTLWIEAAEQLREKLPIVKRRLEIHFKNLIGISGKDEA
jgi:hypothetical protein